MAKIKLYRLKRTGTIYLQFSNGCGDSSRYALPVKLTDEQWVGQSVTTAHPQRNEITAYLNGILARAQMALVSIMQSQPTRSMTSAQLRDAVASVVFVEDNEHSTFNEAYDAYMCTLTNVRTRSIYDCTRKRIREYDARELEFADITRKWLDQFDRWLMNRSPSVNARAIHMRNIRAVFNYALDYELTTLYPFRRYKIRREETQHRDLTIDDLRALFSYEAPTVRPHPQATKPLDYMLKYIDLAKLMFYLMGINVVDLCALKPSDYYGGRIHYRRAKTGTLYDIKVEPEAAAIIERYRGRTHLISLCDGRADYRSLAKSINKALRRVSSELGLPPVTTYWMRHTWATIAYQLGASTDLVSDCLGHKHGSVITATYINRDTMLLSKDSLNRIVINYVNKIEITKQ